MLSKEANSPRRPRGRAATTRRGTIDGPEIHARQMTGDEFDNELDWAAEEGWNPGLYDGNSFCETDPGGFLIALIDDVPAGGRLERLYGRPAVEPWRLVALHGWPVPAVEKGAPGSSLNG